MIPLKDYNPTRRAPVVTVALIVLNVGAYFLLQAPQGDREETRFNFEHAAIPCEVVQQRPLDIAELEALGNGDDEGCDVTEGEAPAGFADKNVNLAVLWSMFLHGGFLHIAGNMLFLWVFGNNIEDAMGHVGFIAFYLASGLVATGAHVLVSPDSTVPLVGASGAIAGVMGAYLVLYPTVRIRSLIILFVIVLIRDIPAAPLLGIWFVLQFFTAPDAGVAWVAHVGGFAFGALVALALRNRLRPAPPTRPAWTY